MRPFFLLQPPASYRCSLCDDVQEQNVRPSPSIPPPPPRHRFCKLDVLAIAHRKWGHLAVLEEQRAAGRERIARAKKALLAKAAQRE